MSARDAAADYVTRGWAPIPVPWGTKAPTLHGWPELRLTPQTLKDYFNGDRQNIGVLLGQPSGGLVDVDLDCPEAVVAARHLLPDTGGVFGREGNPQSHHLFRCPGIKTTKLTALDGEVLLELRATGTQTVFPPSCHPSGEIVEWVCDNAPVEIEGARLTRLVGLVAAAALIARRWPTHGRHDAALALAGALRRAGWSLDQTVLFMRAVTEAAHDEEVADRVRAVKDTFAEGGATTGWPRLAEILGRDVVGRLRDWLGGQSHAHEGAENAKAEAGSAAANTTVAAPTIQYAPGELPRNLDEAESALLVRGGVYQRGSLLVRVARMPETRVTRSVRRHGGSNDHPAR